MFDRYLNLGGKIKIFLLNFDFPLWIKKIEWNAGVRRWYNIFFKGVHKYYL